MTGRGAAVRRLCAVALAAAVVLFCASAVFFRASDAAFAEGESCVRLYAWAANDDGTVTAFYTSADTAECYAEVPCTRRSYTVDEGEFYYSSHYAVGFSARAAFDAALAVAPEELGVTEDNLKIVFVYATMYEKITSNGEKTQNGGTWLHIMPVSPDSGTAEFKAVSVNANYENWYAVLFGLAAVLLAGAAAGYAAARRLKCRKNRKKSIA